MEELFEAIKAGQRDRVQVLIESSPHALQQRHAGATPILFAAYVGQKGVLEDLLALAPALGPYEAAAVGSLPAMEAALRENPALVEQYSEDGWTLLHLAAFFGQRLCVESILKHGGDPKATSHNGLRNRPLHAAAARNHTDVCTVLLAHGSDPDARQHGGYTALHSAAQHGNEALAEALLTSGASPGLVSDEGKDAAQYAESKGHLALAARLLGLRTSTHT
jgi:ankyrin repeat protein